METASSIERKWYNPEIWPRWLRWSAAAVLPLLIAIVVYIIYAVVNNLMPEVPSSITSLIAVLIAAYMYVASGRIIAPTSQRFVGYTLALTVLVFAGYIGGIAASNVGGSTPLWYSVLFSLAGATGALFAAFTQVDESSTQSREVYAWIPTALRWMLFLPIGVAFALVINVALGVPLLLLHVGSDVIRLVNTPLSMAVFIGVTVAVAPRGKGIIGTAIAALFILIAVVGLFATVDRNLMAQVISGLTHRDASDVKWSTSVWYQSLSFGSVLIASIIGALGAVQAERDRRRVAVL